MSFPLSFFEQLEDRLSLAVYDINQDLRDMSITGFQPGAIQAKLDEIKRQAAARRSVAMAKLDAANAKVATVDVEIEKIAAQIEKEADDALQEFATHTNGGPALEDKPTPLPPAPQPVVEAIHDDTGSVTRPTLSQ